MRGSAIVRGNDATGVIACSERAAGGCAAGVEPAVAGFVAGGCEGAVAQAERTRERRTREAKRRMVVRMSKKKAPAATNRGGWCNCVGEITAA